MKGKVKNIVLTIVLIVALVFLGIVVFNFGEIGGQVDDAGEVIVDVLALIFIISFLAIAGFCSLLGFIISLTNSKNESKGVRIYSYVLDVLFAITFIATVIKGLTI